MKQLTLLFFLIQAFFSHSQRENKVVLDTYLSLINNLRANTADSTKLRIVMNDCYHNYISQGPIGGGNEDHIISNPWLRDSLFSYFDSKDSSLLDFNCDMNAFKFERIGNSLETILRTNNFLFFYIDQPVDDRSYFEFVSSDVYPTKFLISVNSIDFRFFDRQFQTMIYEVLLTSENDIRVKRIY